MEKYARDITFDEYVLYTQTLIVADHEVYNTLLEKLGQYTVSSDIAGELLAQYKERNQAHELALIAIDVTEGKRTLTDLIRSVKECEEEDVSITDDQFVTDDLENLYTQQVQKHGLRWRLDTLNKMLGSLRRGDFGFLFARPETGKTTFLASEISYFAEQLSEDMGPILWFNNEEDGKKVQLRIFQAALGVTLEELFQDRKKANEQYHAKTHGKIKIIDSATTSKTDVERYCKEFKPSAIVFDQLDKIKGFVGDREDLRLGTIYQWARELAKGYCPVIAVSQADGTGEGKKWLTMENVANAKTAKQAEADWILGIGATHQDGFEFIRHLHASKNKLTGDLDTNPALRHGKIDCIIEPETARYKDYT